MSWPEGRVMAVAELGRTEPDRAAVMTAPLVTSEALALEARRA
ncbi:hypothetical protein [Terrabacter sp. Ter38]|nr:hypothetical protein [Terrabacter sp. Ter38]